MVAKWQSSIHFIVAALGLFLMRAISPKDFPPLKFTTSINKGVASS